MNMKEMNTVFAFFKFDLKSKVKKWAYMHMFMEK